MTGNKCGRARGSGMSLPEYHMTAGESKRLTIPIYNSAKKPIDAAGMTARLAISSFTDPDMSPFVIRQCQVASGEDGPAVLFVELVPEDTISLSGKYIYQITGRDSAGDLGVMRGFLRIWPNSDRDAVHM